MYGRYSTRSCGCRSPGRREQIPSQVSSAPMRTSAVPSALKVRHSPACRARTYQRQGSCERRRAIFGRSRAFLLKSQVGSTERLISPQHFHGAGVLQVDWLAPAADAAQFSPTPVDDERARSYWREVDDRSAELLGGLGFWRRWRARLSLASLRHRSG